MNYWEECIRVALDEVGIEATEQQIIDIAECVEGGYENYGLATGKEFIPNPVELENKRLKFKLKLEEEKIHCSECNGEGRITSAWAGRSSNSECWKCRGEGKHLPDGITASSIKSIIK